MGKVNNYPFSIINYPCPSSFLAHGGTVPLRVFPLFFMFFLSHKKASADPAVLALQIVVSAFLFLATLASLVGVVLAHVSLQSGTMTFGSAADSLSLLAFAVSLTLWSHSMTCLMPPEVTVTKKK